LTLEQLETITAWVKEAKINSKARANDRTHGC